MISKQVAHWTDAVKEELRRSNSPLPIDLILSVIHVESRGKAGLVNPSSGASGLTQIMPNTIAWYNELHPAEQITLAELRSSDHNSAVKQIRAGIWVLGRFWKSAFNYLSGRMTNVPIDELAKIADLMYVAGPGAVKKKLDKLSVPTWEAVQTAFPSWNALPHPKNVFARLHDVQWPIESISDWLGTDDIINLDRNPEDGFVLALVGILIAWHMLRGKGPNDGK